MEEKVKQNLIELGVREGDNVGAAVSGGIDSMSLLHCLLNLREEMGISVSVFHMEHGIRGESSICDMEFVAGECERLGVPCIIGRAEVLKAAEEKGISIETAAREARYEFLEKQDADYIATAHHMDDLAETVIMNLVRGSGLSGLCGIPAKRGRFIRPLLNVARREIEAYAQNHGIKYVKDQTNEDTSYTRNYIRKEIIPRLREINEAAAQNIARTSRLLAQDEEALILAAQEAGCVEYSVEGAYIDIKKLAQQKEAVKKRVIRLAAEKLAGLKDLENVHMEAILNLAEYGESGKRIDLSNDLFAAVVYEKLRIGKHIKKEYNISSMALNTGSFTFGDKTFDCGEFSGKPVYGEGKEYFDSAAVAGAVFRFRREGDYIYPLGMDGKKRLSDYLSDKKVPLHLRDSLVVLARGSEVFWAVGAGVSESSKVKNSNIYLIRYGEIKNE